MKDRERTLVELKELVYFKNKEEGKAVFTEFLSGSIEHWDFDYLDREEIGMRGYEAFDIVDELELDIIYDGQVYLTKFKIECESAYECGGYYGYPESYEILKTYPETEVWSGPVEGEIFYCVNQICKVQEIKYIKGCKVDETLIEVGNYFRTLELAEEAARVVMEALGKCYHEQ